MTRRGLLLAAIPFAAGAHAQSGPAWLGTYSGAARFYRSIPLEDIYPPPARPHVELDDRRPFGVQFAVSADDDVFSIWLRIDTGPLQTADDGETMRFGPVVDGVATLAEARTQPIPRTASLTVRPDAVATEALFTHADGSFWRRHFTARFTAGGADLILWIFDAAGTRARTWRGSAVRQVQADRGPI